MCREPPRLRAPNRNSGSGSPRPAACEGNSTSAGARCRRSRRSRRRGLDSAQIGGDEVIAFLGLGLKGADAEPISALRHCFGTPSDCLASSTARWWR
jgi:hypothetical protein